MQMRTAQGPIYISGNASAWQDFPQSPGESGSSGSRRLGVLAPVVCRGAPPHSGFRRFEQQCWGDTDTTESGRRYKSRLPRPPKATGKHFSSATVADRAALLTRTSLPLGPCVSHWLRVYIQLTHKCILQISLVTSPLNTTLLAVSYLWIAQGQGARTANFLPPPMAMKY